MLKLRDPNAEFRVVSMMRLGQGGTWRTEVQRSHVRPLLLWCTRGQGRVTVAGATRGYGPNNAVYIPSGTMHGFSMLGQVQGMAIFFPEALIGDLPEDPLHIRIRDGFLQAELGGLIDALAREAEADRAGRDRAMRHWAGLIGLWLERNLSLAERAPEVSSGQRLVAAFVALVERDYRSGRGVAGYAEHLGVTPTHLTRVCRQNAGKSAHRILNDRIHFEARRLLSESQIPIKDIAGTLGFSSAAYFSRAFQNETGTSPTEFRRNT